jgi:hypothetical protein
MFLQYAGLGCLGFISRIPNNRTQRTQKLRRRRKKKYQNETKLEIVLTQLNSFFFSALLFGIPFALFA